jgi:hypothetical protein
LSVGEFEKGPRERARHRREEDANKMLMMSSNRRHDQSTKARAAAAGETEQDKLNFPANFFPFGFSLHT